MVGRMSRTTEAFSRVKIDALLKDAGWNLTDGVSVLFEHALPDGSRADYALCDRSGRPVAAVEAKRARVNLIEAQDQGRHYAEQLGVPFVFLSNGEEVRFLDRETDAHARKIATFYSPDDLERRIAARRNRLELSGVEIDRRIVDREYQIACIEALSSDVSHGRRKLLVEMATGTGKTRTAAAFVKRLFEAGIVTRVLFLVDRIALAGQAEDAFNDHLRDYPCHVLRPGRGFDRTKRITIATLQTMITEVPRPVVGLLRSGDHRRVPPLDLRAVERCAPALRRHPDRLDRNTLHGRRRHAAGPRGRPLRTRHAAVLRT